MFKKIYKDKNAFLDMEKEVKRKIRWGQRGQIYLVAAIIIIIVVLSVGATTNYVINKSDNVKTLDISESLNLESEYVINYGTYNSQQTKEDIIDDFVAEYSQYLTENHDYKNIYFIYGNNNKVYYYLLVEENMGTISFTFGESPPVVVPITQERIYKSSQEVTSEIVKVNIGGKEYEFKLNEGENFYFIVRDDNA